MRWQFILVTLLVGCACVQAKKTENKGLHEWIIQLFPGATTTTTTLRPTNDPPANCPPCQCGIARTRRRIVGGQETKKLEYPWMALLQYAGRFYCGGTLINDLYVLTASHCVAGFRKERMSVRFLEHDRSMPNETKTIDRKVAEAIYHPRYDPGTYNNDIAILKLDKRVDLSSALKRIKRDDGGDVSQTTESSGSGSEESEEDDIGLRPVCLPSYGLSYKHLEATVTGWGTTGEGGSVANVLREVNVTIISNEECRQSAYRNRITENMLCAGTPTGGKDACQGDSGGPLIVYDKGTSRFQEVGVVSWGEGCARPDRPGVYSRVNRYLTWIHSQTKDACVCS